MIKKTQKKNESKNNEKSFLRFFGFVLGVMLFSPFGFLYGDKSPDNLIGDVYVYPNPVTSESKTILYVETDGAELVESRIYDVSGNLVFSKQLEFSGFNETGKAIFEEKLSTQSLKPGVYVGVVEGESMRGGEDRKKFRFALLK